MNIERYNRSKVCKKYFPINKITSIDKIINDNNNDNNINNDNPNLDLETNILLAMKLTVKQLRRWLNLFLQKAQKETNI